MVDCQLKQVISQMAESPQSSADNKALHTRRDELSLLPALEAGPLLADGAMGTLLLGRGISAEVCLEALNLSDRRLIEAVHREYISAGADIIGTNTYAANRCQLSSFGLEDKVWSINVWGAKVARQAREVSGRPVLVAGSMGPLGRSLEPVGSLTKPEAEAAFREQAEALLAGGVDLFLIETMSDVEEAVAALAAVQAICRLPVVLQFTFTPEKATPAGQIPSRIMRRLNELEKKPAVVGVNCGSGPQVLIEVLREMREASDFPCYWSILPNAGMPVKVGNRQSYQAIPDYFGRAVIHMIEVGARLVGGCCGTTPAHIKAMRASLDHLLKEKQSAGTFPTPLPSSAAVQVMAPSPASSSSPAVALSPAPPLVPEAHLEQPASPQSRFAARLAQGFVISVELDPPKGAVATKFIGAGRLLCEAGVDAINVADSPMARVRMASLVGAHLLMKDVGVETIMHFTTRDRNLMGIQSDLLGAHSLGIRNILALTGDSPTLGNVARATAVYDLDSIGLIHVLSGLNRGIDVAGNSIGEPTSFTIGCALSPNAENLEKELERFRRKLEAGAHFVMTQPLYELEPLYRVLDQLGGCPVPILLGLMPLYSLKQAEYLHNEVPGISIPLHVRQELEKAGDDALRIGLEHAAGLVAEARPHIAGVYVVGSFGKYEPIARFVRDLRSAGYI
ncbi:MAG TPA: bifunctional homocysteine S-methyltransferase/methylenetetrahydrofolate reductase [Firmicutes bacterium]|nr:bifunctional homocysteine S-methyltransferase/methylenetetrahydrofolate reductase [Bacillota bacterium]